MLYNIYRNRDYRKLVKCLGEKPRFVLVRNICDNAKVYFVSSFLDTKKLVVLPDERSAILFYEDYKFYDKEVYYFGEKDLLFENARVDDDKLVKDRTNILKKLLNDEKITVITTISSCLEKLPSVDKILDRIIKLKKNDEIDMTDFIHKLSIIGYERVSEVSARGEFAVRGGIIDIFEICHDEPIRIDFFDNIIETIKYFNIDTKRSTEELIEIDIVPMQKDDIDTQNDTFILDYFGNDNMIFLDEPKRLMDRINLLIDMVREGIESRQFDVELKSIDLFDSKYVLDTLSSKRCIQITSIDDAPYVNEEKFKLLNSSWDYDFDFLMTTPIFDKKDYKKTKLEIKDYLAKDFSGLIVLNSHTRAERLVNELQIEGINAFLLNDKNSEIVIKNVGIYVGELSSGFIDNANKFFIFTEKDLLGIEPERKHRVLKKSHRDGYVPINDLSELKLGDYVVHDNYGVGIFCGIERIESDGTTKDYVKIEYADGGFLYVLATKLELLERFASKTARIPKLNKLGTNDFIKLKNKVREDAFETAKDLINLYAMRKESKGFKFSEDTLWQKEFEETFPYIETYDQLLAIDSVKSDMESEKTMDRLICGDVGFGKTEVAIRAAFKATQDGKQVCYLVPTTVLCMQHYRNFVSRFEKYPISIKFLSRFNTKKENEEIVKELKDGLVDIVIGTHRLLSNDIEFKNLGLLIIDEEQRFGVVHKEKIKKLRHNVDVISLTATPIPRTLYMSLSGIRDMSMLNEAPPERMPIKTYVLEYNNELIREAINRELKRDGQVFIVHNKVSDIYEFAEKIEKLCPYAKISVIHGKLNEKELSDIMMDFIDKKSNVLVTTTIIETGLDIQNANTLIIDNAEQFGLSQLYQLRGRVGRSNRTAYAFFMYRKSKELTELEFERLKTIKENTALGSGLKIAMKDLEMRGAGNILGASQSGHIEAVGYDLYMKLLNEAVDYIHKEKEKIGNDNDIDIVAKKDDFVNEYDTVVDIDIDAYIPETYIDSEEVKLNVYRKISKCKTDNEFSELTDELNDRFGKMPKELLNLMFIAKLKIKAHTYYITKLNVKNRLMTITFAKNNKLDADTVFDIINKFCGAIRVTNGENVTLTYRANENEESNVEKTLKIANFIIDNLKLKEAG